MKCIQIDNVMKTINTMRHQTIYKLKGESAVAGLGTPGAGGTRRCRRTLSFVYGLMSHCIDRFHFVFYLYTFHFMHPMCIRLIFLVIFSIFLFFMFLFILFILRVLYLFNGSWPAGLLINTIAQWATTTGG